MSNTPKPYITIPTGQYLWLHYGNQTELISPDDFLLNYRIKRAIRKLKKRHAIMQEYAPEAEQGKQS